MDKIKITENVEIEEHQLEDFVQNQVRDMGIDSLKEYAFNYLVEFYKDNPKDLEDYFDDDWYEDTEF